MVTNSFSLYRWTIGMSFNLYWTLYYIVLIKILIRMGPDTLDLKPVNDRALIESAESYLENAII